MIRKVINWMPEVVSKSYCRDCTFCRIAYQCIVILYSNVEYLSVVAEEYD